MLSLFYICLFLQVSLGKCKWYSLHNFIYFQHGNVAMHYAARGGYLDLVKYLIRKGADPNSLNDVNIYSYILSTAFILFCFICWLADKALVSHHRLFLPYIEVIIKSLLCRCESNLQFLSCLIFVYEYFCWICVTIV